MREIRGGIQPLARTLAQLAARLGMEERLEEQRVLAAWPQAVGEELARRTRPLRWRQGILVVAVPGSSWAAQLALMERDLVARVNQLLGRPRVQGVRWEVRAAGAAAFAPRPRSR